MDLWEGGRIAPHMSREGEEIIRQGEAGDTLYLIERGRFAVYVRDAGAATERHLGDLNVGEFFGELAILREEPHVATVRSLTDGALLAVREDAVQALMRRFPSAATGLFYIMIQRQAGLGTS